MTQTTIVDQMAGARESAEFFRKQEAAKVPEQANRMQWEYHFEERELDVHNLNKLGADGWELISVTLLPTFKNVTAVFKRQLKA